VLRALRVGSFLLSSVFAYFFGNAKSMMKKMLKINKPILSLKQQKNPSTFALGF
jgi:hypothetical protein